MVSRQEDQCIKVGLKFEFKLEQGKTENTIPKTKVHW